MATGEKSNKQYMSKTRTDCRTPRGVSVALIDTINILCRELYKKKENMNSKAAKEAIKDLQEDEHASFILKKLLSIDLPTLNPKDNE